MTLLERNKMNEQIRELQLKAIEYADSVVPAERRYNDIYYDIVSAKLAELIVVECTKVLFSESEQYAAEADATDNARKSEDNWLRSETCMVNVDKIEYHFGVE